jgi:hypothetical protein
MYSVGFTAGIRTFKYLHYGLYWPAQRFQYAQEYAAALVESSILIPAKPVGPI